MAASRTLERVDLGNEHPASHYRGHEKQEREGAHVPQAGRRPEPISKLRAILAIQPENDTAVWKK
jgi:hypothetical protein